jgi:ABC-2 type transport system permease protein
MTSQTSFNQAGILKHSFKTALKASLIPSIVSFFPLFYLAVAINYGFFGPNFTLLSSTRRADYIYVLYDMAAAPFILGIVICGALACALFTFAFMYKKNAVNVYFSLGLARRKLFATRYLAGTLMSVAPIILVLLISYIGNLLLYGPSPELYTAFPYVLLGYVTAGILAFTITSLMCVFCGTMTEAIFLSAYGLGGISLVLLGLNFLMINFLFGNPYGKFNYLYQTVEKYLVLRIPAINPVLFFTHDAAAFSFLHSESAVGFIKVVLPPVKPAAVISWLMISGILFLLAQKLFERRKAEIAGITGTSRGIGFVCTFMPTFFFFSLSFMVLLSSLRQPLAFSGAAAVGLVAYILSEMVFRQFPFLGDLRKLPLVAGACLLCIVVLVTGGLGFSRRIPKAETIEKAYISYKGSPDYMDLDFSTSSTDTYAYTVYNVDYSTPEDIERVLALHNSLIEYGKRLPNQEATVESPDEYTINSPIKIEYTLTNGRTFVRFYESTSVSNLIRLLEMDETETVKNIIDYRFEDKNPSRLFTYLPVFLTNPYFGGEFMFEPDEKNRAELLQALRSDLARQTVKQRYFPDKPALGVIIFAHEEDRRTSWGFGKYEIHPHSSNPRFYITEDFTQTLAFLEAHNLLQYFAPTGEMQHLTVWRYIINPPRDQVKYHYFRSYQSGYSGRQITDPAQQAEILRLARTHYFAAEGGYVIGVSLKDKRPTYLFLPEKDAPPYIKDIK